MTLKPKWFRRHQGCANTCTATCKTLKYNSMSGFSSWTACFSCTTVRRLGDSMYDGIWCKVKILSRRRTYIPMRHRLASGRDELSMYVPRYTYIQRRYTSLARLACLPHHCHPGPHKQQLLAPPSVWSSPPLIAPTHRIAPSQSPAGCMEPDLKQQAMPRCCRDTHTEPWFLTSVVFPSSTLPETCKKGCLRLTNLLLNRLSIKVGSYS